MAACLKSGELMEHLLILEHFHENFERGKKMYAIKRVAKTVGRAFGIKWVRRNRKS